MTVNTRRVAIPTLADIARHAMASNPGWLDEAVSPCEAGKITGYAESSLEVMRIRGNGPVYTKHGKYVRYIRRDLFDWLREGRRRSTSKG